MGIGDITKGFPYDCIDLVNASMIIAQSHIKKAVGQLHAGETDESRETLALVGQYLPFMIADARKLYLDILSELDSPKNIELEQLIWTRDIGHYDSRPCFTQEAKDAKEAAPESRRIRQIEAERQTECLLFVVEIGRIFSEHFEQFPLPRK